MRLNSVKTWIPVLIVFLAGGIATALVPQSVPILGPIAREFRVDGASLGWIVSFPTLACAVGALAFGMVVDRLGDVRLLLVGIVLVILGDAGVSLAPELRWLYAARLFQGLGYVSISVAGPTFIQRITIGDMRRAAMAFWAAHTPAGFAAAVFVGAQFLAAGFSWRWTFLPHAAAALLVGLAALALGRAPSAANVSRSAGTWRVLTSPRAYAVALGSLAAANFQVGVMTPLPLMLAEGHGFSGPQAAIVIVFAMLANWGGAMVIVATRLRKIPTIALPIAAVSAAFFGYATVTGLATDLPVNLAFILAFAATIGTANALVWSLLPAAVPSPEAAGATAGLITQGTFLGVLVGPPIFFWIRHESAVLVAGLALILTVLMLLALYAHSSAGRTGVGKAAPATDVH
jgi:predicted MFS family arabinose efflux permease